MLTRRKRVRCPDASGLLGLARQLTLHLTRQLTRQLTRHLTRQRLTRFRRVSLPPVPFSLSSDPLVLFHIPVGSAYCICRF